jgi:hypothetical protein
MNKTLLLFISVLTILALNGQTVNRTHHRGGVTTSGQMVGINSKSFYLEVTSLYNGCCRDRAYVVGIGDAGEEIFRTQVNMVAYLHRPRIAVSADKCIFTCSGTKYKGCDVGGKLSTVYKLDTLGYTKWSINLSEEIDHLVALADGGVGIIIADDFIRYNVSGNLVSSTLLSSGPLSGICALSSGNLLLSYAGTSGPRLRVINLKDSVLSDIAFPSLLPVLKEGADGNIYGINNGFLMKVSLSSGLLLHSSGKLPANMSVNNVQIRNDSLFALASSSLASINFLILDTGFHVVHQKSSNISSVFGAGFYVGNNNQLNVISIGGNGYSYGGFLQTALTGNLNANYDIGVIGISVLDSSHAHTGGMYRATKISADVTLKNFGTDTVKQFHLSHYATITGITFCLVGLHKEFTVTIPPNGTVSVNTGTFSSKPPSYYFPESYEYNLCVYATTPDYQHDVNTSNDGLCRTIHMVPVGVKEVKAENSLSVYPNPVKEKINITSFEEINTAQVFDLNGRLMKTIKTNSGTLQEVDINLPEGIYILNVETKSGVRNHKFCVVNN